MKLRNNKTGEIIDIYKGEITLHYNQGRKTIHFKRLEDLEEWEDYEEPKEGWYINEFGTPTKADFVERETLYDKCRKNFGNYFETKEEADKAVEKLKAWKRLKDKGFRFTGVAGISNNIYVSFETDSKYSGGHVMYDKYSNTDNNLREYNEDLMLLFGGEE